MSDSLELHLTKVIKAKRSRVFAAWTEAELMRQWLAPGELISPRATSDPRVGGNFIIHMEGMMGEKFTRGIASGTFEEIVPNERLVFTWNWEGDYRPPQTVITVSLRDVDGGTELTLSQVGFGDEGHQSGYSAGWESAFAKLRTIIE